MTKLEKAYLAVNNIDRIRRRTDSSPVILLVTIIYLIAVLSVPVDRPQGIVWLAAYPVIASEMQGIGYGKVFVKSIWILPLLVIIGVFNPIFDKVTVLHIGSLAVNRGWLTFISIIFRGLLSFQAVILMILTTGFIDIFNMMRKVGFPSVLCTQMLLSYRYLFVILEEAIVMKRAREARGYGRKAYPFSMWGRFIGQLLMKSTRRATGIHRAMMARGFSGTLPLGAKYSWNKRSWIWLISWTAVIALLRFMDFSKIITEIIVR